MTDTRATLSSFFGGQDTSVATTGNIVVTGATGFLGSHFVYEWLRTHSDHVFALVRGKGMQAGAGRLASALELAAWANGRSGAVSTRKLTAIDGDVTQPLAGVAPECVAQMRDAGADVFWHLAADLRFEERNREAVWHNNVSGARHALDLAVAVGVKRFVYVSTAFVCGQQSGAIEETHVPLQREFNNGYEASKAAAERLLVAECERLGLPLTLLRPSIVIGPRSTQCAYGSDTGLYSLVPAVLLIRSSLSGQSARLRIPASPEAEINFVPVDTVVADMLALARSGYGSQQVYHLTSSASVSVAQCWRAVAEATGMHNVVLVPPDSFEPSPAERIIARRVGFFLNYIGTDRRFVRSLGPTGMLSAAEFAGFVRKAQERAESGAYENRHAG